MDPIDTKNYITVTYRDFHTKELEKVRRSVPPKIHDMLPTDVVALTDKRSDDFKAGDEMTVKNFTKPSPNIIQIENNNGDTTFVSSYDLLLKKKVASRGIDAIDDEIASRYLLWP